MFALASHNNSSGPTQRAPVSNDTEFPGRKQYSLPIHSNTICEYFVKIMYILYIGPVTEFPSCLSPDLTLTPEATVLVLHERDGIGS